MERFMPMKIKKLFFALSLLLSSTLHSEVFRTDSVVNDSGIDRDGFIHANLEIQSPAPDYVIFLLDNPHLFYDILNDVKIVKITHIGRDHLVFKVKLKLNETYAELLKTPTIDISFKPEVYNDEYKREILFNNLGSYFGLTSLVPIRKFKLPITNEQLRDDAVWEKMNEESSTFRRTYEKRHKKKIINSLRKNKEGTPYLLGSAQLWVKGVMTTIGRREFNKDTLKDLSKKIVKENLNEKYFQRSKHSFSVNNDPIWQSLSDMFLLDFLVYNSDRKLEGGTISFSAGNQRLILLDNGDSLWHAFPNLTSLQSRSFFNNVKVFTHSFYQRLKQLDERTLKILLKDEDGVELVRDIHQFKFMQRRAEALNRIEKLMNDYGTENVFFKTNNRAMPDASKL